MNLRCIMRNAKGKERFKKRQRRRTGRKVIISGEDALSAPCHTFLAHLSFQPPLRWIHDNSVPCQICVGASLCLETFCWCAELEIVDKCSSLCPRNGKFWEAFCIFQKNFSKINPTIAEALIILPIVFFPSFLISLSPLPNSAFRDHLQNILPTHKSLPQTLLN